MIFAFRWEGCVLEGRLSSWEVTLLNMTNEKTPIIMALISSLICVINLKRKKDFTHFYFEHV